MIGASSTETIRAALLTAGLAEQHVQSWLDAEPPDLPDGRSASDAWSSLQPYVSLGDVLLDRLPDRSKRSSEEQVAADLIENRLRSWRINFLRAHVAEVFASIAHAMSRPVRAEELVARAAIEFPGLTPNAERMGRESARPLKDKLGHEIDQGLLLWQVLAHPEAGARLVHDMLRPTPASLDLLEGFQRAGHVDLGLATVTRDGNAGIVEHRNTAYLNAEDDDTNRALEVAIDLVILDPACEVGVLRGSTVEHPKYSGRRVFNAGLNLTRLYEGRLPFLFYMTRDLGLVNKIYRGHSTEQLRRDEGETGVEKPWIAAVESFAIGGGCQLLLVMDYVLAERGSYFSLPARKEGIIPGAANLRLPRLVGDRMARRAILFDKSFSAESPEGLLLCDELVNPGEMNAAITRTCAGLSSSGVVSAAGNRKAIRVGQEPLSAFQAYMATYAREQSCCHLSPALVRNLEQYWLARHAPRE